MNINYFDGGLFNSYIEIVLFHQYLEKSNLNQLSLDIFLENLNN
ncbi:hypothetical protein ACLFLI_18510 [Mammaliicoccus sciuri]